MKCSSATWPDGAVNLKDQGFCHKQCDTANNEVLGKQLSKQI